MSIDLLLNQQREALLRIARSRREWLDRGSDRETDPIGAAQDEKDFRAKKEKVAWAGNEMAKFYARGVAEDVEALIPLIDLIPDEQRRLEAMGAILRLIAHAQGEAEFRLRSPAGEMLMKLGTENARSAQRAEQAQRRKRMWPFVAEMMRDPFVAEFMRNHPKKAPARITTLLRKRIAFQKEFGSLETLVAMRRTFEADVEALLAALSEAE